MMTSPEVIDFFPLTNPPTTLPPINPTTMLPPTNQPANTGELFFR